MEIIRRVKFYWIAKTIYDIHSPFLYELVDTIIYCKPFSIQKVIQSIPDKLKNSTDIQANSNGFNRCEAVLQTCCVEAIQPSIVQDIQVLIILESGKFDQHRIFFDANGFNCLLYLYDLSIGFKLPGYLGTKHNFLISWYLKPWRLGFF
jgi:hypothetical protein